MQYKLVQMDDAGHTIREFLGEDLPLDSRFIFTVPPEVTDADFQKIKEEIRAFFGNSNRQIDLMRADDLAVHRSALTTFDGDIELNPKGVPDAS